MPFAPNHSNNLPRDFGHCPACGKKGFYRYGGNIFREPSGTLTGMPPGKRCKYCRHAQPEMTVPEYEAHLNTFGRGES